MKISEVMIDNRRGLGATPNNDNVDYLGLRVLMKPTKFLLLAAYIGRNNKVDDLRLLIQNGKSIGAPFLGIEIPKEWNEGDLTPAAKVTNHEGRHRMRAILELEDDIPVEVHLFFGPGYRARHITPEMIKRLNKSLLSEENTLFHGPFFTIKGAVDPCVVNPNVCD